VFCALMKVVAGGEGSLVQGWAEIYPVNKSQTDHDSITELLKTGMQNNCPGCTAANKNYPDLSARLSREVRGKKRAGAFKKEQCNKPLETEFNKLLSAEKVVAFADPAIREAIADLRFEIAQHELGHCSCRNGKAANSTSNPPCPGNASEAEVAKGIEMCAACDRGYELSTGFNGKKICAAKQCRCEFSGKLVKKAKATKKKNGRMTTMMGEDVMVGTERRKKGSPSVSSGSHPRPSVSSGSHPSPAATHAGSVTGGGTAADVMQQLKNSAINSPGPAPTPSTGGSLMGGVIADMMNSAGPIPTPSTGMSTGGTGETSQNSGGAQTSSTSGKGDGSSCDNCVCGCVITSMKTCGKGRWTPQSCTQRNNIWCGAVPGGAECPKPKSPRARASRRPRALAGMQITQETSKVSGRTFNVSQQGWLLKYENPKYECPTCKKIDIDDVVQTQITGSGVISGGRADSRGNTAGNEEAYYYSQDDLDLA